MAARNKPASSPDSNRVVVELRVNQQPEYQTVNKRSDGAWEQREKEWGTAKGRARFAASEMRSGFGFDLSQSADIGTVTETPTDVKEALEQTRIWYKKSFFIQDIVKTKLALFNYGFQVKAEDNDADDSDDEGESKSNDRLDAWLRKYRTQIKRFVREAWLDKLTMNNAVAFWRKNQRLRRVITLPPERCKYSDALGIEKLSVRLGWHEDDFKTSPTTTDKVNFLMPREDVKRYAQGNFLPLLESQGEYFRVYKEERTGWGFAWPSVQSLFHTAAQEESLQISDRLWSFVSRTAERRHKIGHEIKQGPRAGLPIHFITKERAAAVTGFYEGRVGFFDTVLNFDQDIEFPFPSNDRFDKEKYQSVWGRMALWAGPVGHYLFGLYTGKGAMPMLMEMIQPEAEEARDFLSDFLVDVITEVFQPPVPIKVCWSNRCFADKRQAQEMVKFLVSCGAMSQRTALELYGFDASKERERKQEEWDLAQDEKTKGQIMPAYDPAHGDPAQLDVGGRPAGQKDGNTRVQLNGEA